MNDELRTNNVHSFYSAWRAIRNLPAHCAFIRIEQYIIYALLDFATPRILYSGHGCAGRGPTGAPPAASESCAGEGVAPA